MIRKTILLLLITGTYILSCSDNPGTRNEKNESIAFDLDSIRVRGKIIAVTDYNSTSYFIYRGEPMGFQFELLRAFSDHVGLDLDIVSENNLKHAFSMLNSGEADILALNLTVNDPRKESILFTEPIAETRQVLIQRKPYNWRDLTLSDLGNQLIRKPGDLARKKVYVQESSAHVKLLNEISEETGGKINIVEVPFESERLIRMVANGDIDFAVCDENIAVVNSAYYPDIDVSTYLSTNVNLAWGIRKNNSEQLLTALNDWIVSFRKTSAYAIMYAKYFNNSRTGAMFSSDYFSINTGKISPWDDLIKMYSDSIKWDWRLLAALIYQESRFIPNVVSAAGAFGLMQIMPETAKNFGIDITSSPKNNIKAGTSYINWLHKIFDPKIEDENERIKFILASYNAGPGHILDAMKLAEKHGMDPQKWEGSVAVWLQKKSEPKYYNDAVVKSGYFRGKESIAFVSQILDRYGHYKNILPPSGEK